MLTNFLSRSAILIYDELLIQREEKRVTRGTTLIFAKDNAGCINSPGCCIGLTNRAIISRGYRITD